MAYAQADFRDTMGRRIVEIEMAVTLLGSLRCSMVALGFGLIANAGHAAGFTSPSGNITCYLNIYSDLDYDDMQMVCLVFEADWDIPRGASDDEAFCDLDQTRTVILPPQGPARTEWSCHGDIFWPIPLGALGYGSEWSISGYSCTMATDGVRCENGSGGSMQVRRASVVVE